MTPGWALTRHTPARSNTPWTSPAGKVRTQCTTGSSPVPSGPEWITAPTRLAVDGSTSHPLASPMPLSNSQVA